MDAFDAMHKRRSIREFVAREVEFEKLVNILDAANHAPSAGNLQEWRFIVVYRNETKEQLAKCAPKQEWISQAPILIVASADVELSEQMWGSRAIEFATQNVCAATQNLITAATAEGLGTCWVSSFVAEQVQETLGMPQSARPFAIIALGYYEDDPVPLPKKSVDDVVFFHEWGNREKSFAKANAAYHTYVTDALEAINTWLKK